MSAIPVIIEDFLNIKWHQSLGYLFSNVSKSENANNFTDQWSTLAFEEVITSYLTPSIFNNSPDNENYAK